jgi:diguanylate cyclase
MVGAAVAVLVRAALIPRDRLAWTLIGAGLTAWAAGDIYSDVALADQEVIPYPSLADALYLVDFVGLIAGVRLLGARPRGSSVISLSLVVTILGLATVWSWLVFDEVSAVAGGGTAAVATTLAYPLFDLVLLSSVLIALAAREWRFDRVFFTLATGFAVGVVADSIYAVQVAQGTWVPERSSTRST